MKNLIIFLLIYSISVNNFDSLQNYYFIKSDIKK